MRARRALLGLLVSAVAGCSTAPCPVLQGRYLVTGTCSCVETCPLTQSACSGTLVCPSGLACTGEVSSDGTASFTCGGRQGMGPCSGTRAPSGTISLSCQAPGGACTLTLTPVADAG